jgi:hypothetical protein
MAVNPGIAQFAGLLYGPRFEGNFGVLRLRSLTQIIRRHALDRALLQELLALDFLKLITHKKSCLGGK